MTQSGSDHEVARQVALATGRSILKVQQEFLSTSTGIISPTQRTQLGRQGDLAGHLISEQLLQELRPSDAILSEEGFHDGARTSAQRLWIVDPLDGTSNFSRGDGEFAVHVALWDNTSETLSHIAAASVYVPHRREMWSMDDEPSGVVAGLQPESAIKILVSRSREPSEIEFVSDRLHQITGRRIVQIPMSSVGAKVAALIRNEADIYINTGGFHEWDIAAPLGVAQHHGLAVCDRFGDTLKLNKASTEVPDAIICKPEFVSVLVDSLAW